MSNSPGKNVLGAGVISVAGGLASALGLQTLGIIGAGIFLLGGIGNWWFLYGAAAYYTTSTTTGDITAITGDDASMMVSGNPVLVALAMERHIKTDYNGSLNNYDYNDPIMQSAIAFWRKECGGLICSYALPKGKKDAGVGATDFVGCDANVAGFCGNGLQCAYFVHTVYALSGNPLPAAGNAIDYWWADRAAFERAGWNYINNGSGMPSIGDLAVMDHPPYGHILIVVGVDLPQAGGKGAVYLAQANAPGNTSVNGAELLKWSLEANGFAEQTWSGGYTLLGFIHNTALSQKWGDPFHATVPYTSAGDAQCDKKAPPLPEEQARALAMQAGFSGRSLDEVIAVAHAESSLNPKNCLVNNDKLHTIDRGILQINNHWHSEVSDACAYDPACAFKEGYRISNKGTNFTPWMAYTSGAYQKYMP